MRIVRLLGLWLFSLVPAVLFVFAQTGRVQAEDEGNRSCLDKFEIDAKISGTLPVSFQDWCHAEAGENYQFTLEAHISEGEGQTYVIIDEKEYKLTYSIELYSAERLDDGRYKAVTLLEYDRNTANTSGTTQAKLTKTATADQDWYVKYTVDVEHATPGNTTVTIDNPIDAIAGGGCFDCDGFGVVPIEFTWPPPGIDIGWTEDFLVNPIPLPLGTGPGPLPSPWFTEGLLDPGMLWGNLGALDASSIAIPN